MLMDEVSAGGQEPERLARSSSRVGTAIKVAFIAYEMAGTNLRGGCHILNESASKCESSNIDTRGTGLTSQLSCIFHLQTQYVGDARILAPKDLE